MTYAALQTIIRNNVDESSGDVDAAIDLAIQHISNFFYLRKTKTATNAATGDTSIAKPDRCLKVLNVRIGDDFIKKLDLDKQQAAEDDNTLRWYIGDEFISGNENKIYLTKALGSSYDGNTVKVRYLAGFTPLNGSGSTDLPERLEAVLVSYATYFYYGILVSQIKNNKAAFPNMTIWDIIAIWDTWRIHSAHLLREIRKQHFNLEG